MRGSQMDLKLTDRVRYIGTADQDTYHGGCVGREGVVRQLYPWVGVEFDGEQGVRSVARELVERA